MTKAIQMNQSLTLSADNKKTQFNHLYDMANTELMLMKKAEERMIYKEGIVKTYGIVSGTLPEKLTTMFNLPANVDVFGLVLQFEGCKCYTLFVLSY